MSDSANGADRPAPRRVLYLVDALGNGGLERQMTLLAANLPPRWQPYVTALTGGPFAGEMRRLGIPLRITAAAHRFDPRKALALNRLILRLRPDIIHAWGWQSLMLAGPACLLRRPPVIDGTIQSGWVVPQHQRFGHLYHYWTSYYLPNSRAGMEAYNITPAQGSVVYNGFDEARLPASFPERPVDRGDGRFVYVMIGRMHPDKDYPTVFAAARQLEQREPGRFQFLAIGDGPLRGQWQRECADLVAAGAVSFPQPGLEVLEHVARADAGVLMTTPPIVEGCSNAIMEYMACGLPVVAACSGGNPELVRDGESGLLVPPADAAALAEALRRMRADPAMRAHMGQVARQRIREDFSLGRYVDEMVSHYDRLCHDRA